MKTEIGSTTFEVIDGVIHGFAPGCDAIPYSNYPCSTEEEFLNSVNHIFVYVW